jgi:hypothetical protein
MAVLNTMLGLHYGSVIVSLTAGQVVAGVWNWT